MNIAELLTQAAQEGASDVFIVAGLPFSYKINGKMVHSGSEKLMPADTEAFVRGIYELAGQRDIQPFFDTGDDDFSFAIKGVSRFRVSTYKQRGSLAAVVRIISFSLPTPEVLGITPSIMKFADCQKGLVLVTGPAGSGKSTTLACMIDKINHEQEKHIITLEDPLEYLHSHKKVSSARERSTRTQAPMSAPSALPSAKARMLFFSAKCGTMKRLTWL